MAYVAVKGGERAISNAQKLIDEERRGDRREAALTLAQLATQLSFAVDRVMAEGSLYDRELAALAFKQAQGDMVEAVFLLRAFRTTLTRFGATEPLDTGRMAIERRISAIFKDVPGGQVLGATYDYTHRLLDFTLASEVDAEPPAIDPAVEPLAPLMPRVVDFVREEGLLVPISPSAEAGEPHDLTREPLSLPATRDQRLQNLARADEGFVVALAYSSLRGFGASHPYVGELRVGEVPVEFVPEELGFAVDVGDLSLAECQMVDPATGPDVERTSFSWGYGLAPGKSERKAIAMAVLDRSLRASDFGEEIKYPAQDEEFVLTHSDSLEATGFLSHLKLPHYVDFQADLLFMRKARAAKAAAPGERDGAGDE